MDYSTTPIFCQAWKHPHIVRLTMAKSVEKISSLSVKSSQTFDISRLSGN